MPVSKIFLPLALMLTAGNATVVAMPDHEIPDSAITMAEVSVTAIKQSIDMSLQPVASTIVGRHRLERLNIVSMKGASAVVPNFFIPDYGTRMTSSIYVRGIGARIDQPVVGLNVDNVPFLNKDCYDFDLPDIERIEMIRGPQSSLYGRNTMGGLINIYTISPMAYTGVRAMVEGGSHDLFRGSVAVYGRLSGNLAMSVAGAANHTDGLWRNTFNNSRIGGEDAGSVRWRTVWRPSQRLSIDNVASFSLNHQDGYPYEQEGAGHIAYNDTCFYRRRLFTDGLTLRWRPNHRFSLSSITSVQYLDDNMTLDQDFTTDRYFTLSQRRHEWTVTQDIVARSRTGAYERLTGVFGFLKLTDMSAPVRFFEDGIQRLIVDHRNQANPDYPIAWDSDNFLLGSDFSYPVFGVAAYHQSTVEYQHWKASLGLRLDYEHAALSYHSFCNTGFTIYDATVAGQHSVFRHDDVDIDDHGRLSRDFLQLLPKFTLSYALPMHTPGDVYLSVGRGYKSGGFNTQMFSDVLQQRLMSQLGLAALYTVDDIVSYKPEKSWNYEIGAHVNCADGRVATDIALFYIDCRDQQLTMFPDGTTTGRITTNAGRTRSYGAELQVNYRPSSPWLFNLSYGYTNATFRQFFNGKTDYRGKRVPYAPQSTMYAGLTYSVPTPALGPVDRLSATAGCRGVGDIYWNEDNLHRQPFYALLNASVSASIGPATLDLWCENLTDTRYHTFSFISIGNTFFQSGRPRMFGATLRLSFGQQ